MYDRYGIPRMPTGTHAREDAKQRLELGLSGFAENGDLVGMLLEMDKPTWDPINSMSGSIPNFDDTAGGDPDRFMVMERLIREGYVEDSSDGFRLTGLGRLRVDGFRKTLLLFADQATAAGVDVPALLGMSPEEVKTDD